MNLVVFNFHDVVLWMTAMQCLLFAGLLLATNTSKNISMYFLAAFLVAHALIPLHEMILWGAEFKLRVRNNWPEVYFIGAAAYYVDGALLLMCIKSLVFRDFKFSKTDLLHLLPLAAFIVFMSIAFYSHSYAERLHLINSETFVYGAGYTFMEFFSKVVRFGYCFLCLQLVFKYKHLLKSTHSNVEKVDITWISMLVVGFMIVMGLEAILAFSKVIFLFKPYHMDFFQKMGLTCYYSLFLLVNLLVFTGIRYFSSFEPVKEEPEKPKDGAKKKISDHLLNPDLAREIDEAMRGTKSYMEPDITLEHLAEELSITARDLSMIINRHFGVNFYEFVNRYRIEEAKAMLASPKHSDTTITDIYLAVGFNSKSVFNTFFKKLVGTTPSQYRKELA